ncbi:TPA: MMPL family transporter, partial [bacterium]|nr:MMPL family transporter [bacterium]
MNLLADFIVKRKTYILIVFLLLFVVSIFMMPDRKLSYNIFDILPDDIESLIGLKILSEKIAKGPEFTILCEKDDLNEVENLIRKLETLPYIISISWLGTSQDLTYPEEIWRDSESWYKDGVFKVSITLKSSDSYKTQIEQLRGLLPEWAELTGSEVISYDMEDYFKNSTLIYFSLGILLVTVFLFLTFPSFLVPILIVFSMMIGVIINLAITAVSGRSIYFLMDTIVAILQVAVTLDYALFLYHRYEEERLTKERDAAMASAIISSFKP